jgi:NusA-like KH domain protein
MLKTKLDITSIQYLNLFERITGIKTSNCFSYNNALVFAVDPQLFSRAIGEQGRNVKRISAILKKRIKIVQLPERIQDAEKFVKAIVYPVEFRKISVLGDEMTIMAGSQSKASLIGRDSRRLIELQTILENFFQIKKLKIA